METNILFFRNPAMPKSEFKGVLMDMLNFDNFTSEEHLQFPNLEPTDFIGNVDIPTLTTRDSSNNSFLDNLSSKNSSTNKLFSSFHKFSELFDSLNKTSFNLSSSEVNSNTTESNVTTSNLRFFLKLTQCYISA